MQRWDEMKHKKIRFLAFLIMLFMALLVVLTTISAARAVVARAQELPKLLGEPSKWEITGLTKPHISALEITPYGVLASEFDTGYWTLPYNGIYFSGDDGHSWVEFGLKNYGVTDVKYANGKIYATTHYSTPSKPAGLYYTGNR